MEIKKRVEAAPTLLAQGPIDLVDNDVFVYGTLRCRSGVPPVGQPLLNGLLALKKLQCCCNGGRFVDVTWRVVVYAVDIRAETSQAEFNKINRLMVGRSS